MMLRFVNQLGFASRILNKQFGFFVNIMYLYVEVRSTT